MWKFPKTEADLVKLANKLNVSFDSCTTSAGLDRAELQKRILAMLAERRNSFLWIISLTASIAAFISSIAAVIALCRK